MPTDKPETLEPELPTPASADALAEEAAQKAREGALAESTRNDYRARFERFGAWCEQVGRSALPASVETACTYLEYLLQEKGFAVGTLRLYAAAIGWTHRREGKPDPTRTDVFSRYMKRQRKEHAGVGTGSTPPLYAEDLKELIRTCQPEEGEPRLKDLRDKALLLAGYAGALRRSEIVQVDRSHLTQRPEGYVLYIPEQKNDQTGEGQQKGIPDTGRWTSPAQALSAWLRALDGALAGVEDPDTEAVFQSLTRGGAPTGRMSTEAVRLVVKGRAEKAGLRESYSPHSLRAGMMTEASEQGAAITNIMAQSGHSDVETAQGYIDVGKALENPALEKIGL